MLAVSQLRKKYQTVVALDGVSFAVGRGEILGLLGPNGAGKTTAIRIVLDILQPDSGSILYDGKRFDPSVRNLVGYLPEERGLYRKNRLLPTILYFANLRGVVGAEAKRRAYAWLKRFDLLAYYDRKVEELSKGNQQKVQFIISILHDPPLVVLDEPFSGLDPVNQIMLKDIFLELKQQGKAIIFSTHQMGDAEKLCDRICLINAGRVVLDGTMQDVKSGYGKNVLRLEFEGDGAFLAHHPAVRSAQLYENYAEIVLKADDLQNELLLAAVERLTVRKFERGEPSLNAIFLELVGATRRVPAPQEMS
jgi:ABC-2 type transport system ATP-binding protein